MEQIKLDIVPAGISPVAHASQFDNSRQIRFNLFNQGTPYTLTGAETVTMVVNGEEENITNTSDNYVIWDVAEEDCAETGVIGCEIRIVLGSMLIGSKNFFLEVEMDPYDGKNIRTITVGPADICTFETTLPEPLQSVLVNVTATGGNGTPDTPIPIVGYTEANITRCGVNLFDCDSKVSGTSAQVVYTSDDDYIYMNGTKNGGTYATFSGALYSLKKGTYYAKAFFISGTATNDPQLSFILPDGSATGNIVNGATFTLSEDSTLYPRFAIWADNTVFSNLKIGIVISTASISEYSEYNGQTYTISFGQTVYGGVLHIENGRTWVEVTHNIVDLGTLNWRKWNTTGGHWRFAAPLTDAKLNESTTTIPDILCEIYEPSTPSATYAGTEGITLGQNTAEVLITDETYSTEAALTTALDNVYMSYPLSTPFDIDLTPVQISAIVGTNNVFADCGETEVEYLAEG